MSMFLGSELRHEPSRMSQYSSYTEADSSQVSIHTVLSHQDLPSKGQVGARWVTGHQMKFKNTPQHSAASR